MAIVCLSVWMVPVTVPAAAQEDGDPLWLTERPFADTNDQWNFTTFPPSDDETGRRRQANQQAVPTFLAEWTWFLTIAPENWSVEEDAEWEFGLGIEGLDQVYPLPGSLYPFTAPMSGGVPSHEIQVQIFSGDDVVTASGSILVPVTEVEAGVQSYPVPVAFNETEEFTRDRSDHFRITVSVSGRGEEAESPLWLHYGGNDQASTLSAPGYPSSALQEMELAYLRQQECQDLILQQKSCELLQNESEDGEPGPGGENTTDADDPPPAVDNGTVDDEGPGPRTAPGPGILFAVVGAAWIWTVARRSRNDPQCKDRSLVQPRYHEGGPWHESP